MSQPLTRRGFAGAGAMVTLGMTSLSTGGAFGSQDAALGTKTRDVLLKVRPYQLMCIICRIGEGRTADLGDARLNEILKAVRNDHKTPMQLCCNEDKRLSLSESGTRGGHCRRRVVQCETGSGHHPEAWPGAGRCEAGRGHVGTSVEGHSDHENDLRIRRGHSRDVARLLAGWNRELMKRAMR